MGKEIECPSCAYSFDPEEGLTIGDTTYCPGCYRQLKVTSTKPFVVKEIGDSWDDFEEDYDDEEER